MNPEPVRENAQPAIHILQRRLNSMRPIGYISNETLLARVHRKLFKLMIAMVTMLPVLTLAQGSTALKESVLVLPLLPGEGVTAQRQQVGFAIENLLENMLVLHGGLEENWFLWHINEMFPREEELVLW